MSAFRARKVVNALPDPLEASTLYCVRSGTGFSLFLTNDLGQLVAYPLNQPGGAGAAEIDFGAHPGTFHASLTIIDQPGIVAGSIVQAWIVSKGTADHSADEHAVDPPRLVAGRIVPGVGFTIDAFPGQPIRASAIAPRGQNQTPNPPRCHGRWSLQWRWQ